MAHMVVERSGAGPGGAPRRRAHWPRAAKAKQHN